MEFPQVYTSIIILYQTQQVPKKSVSGLFFISLLGNCSAPVNGAILKQEYFMGEEVCRCIGVCVREIPHLGDEAFDVLI